MLCNRSEKNSILSSKSDQILQFSRWTYSLAAVNSIVSVRLQDIPGVIEFSSTLLHCYYPGKENWYILCW